MELWQALLLGLVQGLTEFLPVSSSGHLVLVGHWLQAKESGSGAAFEALLHMGTLIPVCACFAGPLRGQLGLLARPKRLTAPAAEDADAELFRFLVIATATTAVLTLPAMSLIDRLFDSTLATGVALLVTTALLAWSRFLTPAEAGTVGTRQAILVGMAQALAVTPGISRSGTTIVVGLLVGIPLVKLGAYSMLLSVPAILGGVVLEVARHPPQGLDWGVCLAAMAVAAASGYLAVRWVLASIRQRRLHWFAPYTALLALLVIVVNLMT